MLQVADNDRKCLPNQRKRNAETNQKSWFLKLDQLAERQQNCIKQLDIVEFVPEEQLMEIPTYANSQIHCQIDVKIVIIAIVIMYVTKFITNKC